MPEPKRLKLTKDWGRHKSGAVLTVLGPGDPLTPASIDPARAATLVASKFAIDAPPPAPPAAATPPLAKSAAVPQEVTRG